MGRVEHHRRLDDLDRASEAILRLKTAFDAHGITIPFPTRTLDFTAAKGGKPLAAVLAERR